MNTNSNIPALLQCTRLDCGRMHMRGSTVCAEHTDVFTEKRVLCAAADCEAEWVPRPDHHATLCSRHELDARRAGEEPEAEPSVCASYGCVEDSRPEVGPGNQWELCERHAIELRKRAAMSAMPERVMIPIGYCESDGCPKANRPTQFVFPELCEEHSDEKVREMTTVKRKVLTGDDIARHGIRESLLPTPPPSKPTGEELVERVRAFVHARIARGHDRECTRTVLVLLLVGNGGEWPSARVEAACDCGLREATQILEP